MTQAAHTPGPWHLCQHLKSMECDAACPCGYRGVVYGPDHGVAYAICQPGHELPRREEEWGSEPQRYPRDVELANMRLIAAAPELLAPSEDAIAILDVAIDLWNATYPDEPDEVFTDLQTRFREAITLATGAAS